MIPKEFDAIAKQDIDALIANAVAEGRTIEYKEQLPGGSDDDRREFLADASSFANAGGGDLIYGVREKRDANGKATGIPEAAEGLASINTDAEKRRLEDMLRNGVEPRLPGVRLQHIDGFVAGPVIVLRVPKSWASPHMVTFKNLSRFFSRTSAGKHQLDVQEIRAAFTASETLLEKIQNFRTERLGRIIGDETPVPLLPTPKVIVHLIPLTISDRSARVDLSVLFQHPHKIPPLQAYGHSHRINFDGVLTYTAAQQKPQCYTYLQVFRSGVFEAVNANLLSQLDGKKLIPSVLLEQELISGITKYLVAAKELGISPPFLLLAALHGVKGFSLARDSHWAVFHEIDLIDRETLLLPDVLIEDLEVHADIVLKPIFDAIWQSVGFPSCEHYNGQGRWDGGRSRLPGARG